MLLVMARPDRRLTAHGSRLTAHGSRLTAHGSRLTAHGSRLTAHYYTLYKTANVNSLFCHSLSRLKNHRVRIISPAYPEQRGAFTRRAGYTPPPPLVSQISLLRQKQAVDSRFRPIGNSFQRLSRSESKTKQKRTHRGPLEFPPFLTGIIMAYRKRRQIIS
jgi:hypothetical protein